MADGRTHAQIASGVAATISTAALPVAFWYDEAAALAMMAGAVAGWLMTPDLDIPHKTHEERRIWDFSPILGFLWQVLWYPYALAIPHRSFWSHMPLVSTAIRAAYVGWWLPLAFPDIPAHLYAIALLSWTLQDVAHLAADGWRLHS